MATLLLKKSYQLSNLKEVNFNDLWGSRGVFTTMRMVGKPPKLILLKPHLENLIKSTKKYGIRALNKTLISVSIRKRPKPKSNFNLLLFKYKRIEPNYKNLYYKKILAKLSKVDSTKFDIALVANDKILETGTSNLVFVKNGKIFSPKKNCYFGNTLKFISKKIKINFKDISIKSINDYDEIILIGSGKGVTSVSKINDLKWKRRKTGCYTKLNKIYNSLV